MTPFCAIFACNSVKRSGLREKSRLMTLRLMRVGFILDRQFIFSKLTIIMRFKTHERKFIYIGNRVRNFCLLNQRLIFNYVICWVKKSHKTFDITIYFCRKDTKSLRQSSQYIIMMFILQFDYKNNEKWLWYDNLRLYHFCSKSIVYKDI
jgi:hypothetical protein